MKYMGDSQWWNERFKERELKIMHHENCLEEDMKYFPRSGKILDIASGDGRNSIYLSQLGYSVHAIDFSEEALTRLNYFSKKENLAIECKLVDLSLNDAFVGLDKYDAIIINHYRLNPNLYNKLMSHLKRNGVLWVNGFREIPYDNPNITDSDVLSESDFLSLDSYYLKSKKFYDIDQRKFVRYIYEK